MTRDKKEKKSKTKKQKGRKFLHWEQPYNRRVDVILDIVVYMIGCTYFLGFGPFDTTIKIVMALVMTGIFVLTPGLSMLVFAFVFFLCTAHINGALAVVIGVILLIMAGSNHRQACLFMLTPLVFTVGSLLDGYLGSVLAGSLPIALWILFIYMSAKYKDFMPASFYSIYFGFMAIMTSSFGASIYGYPKERPWETASFSNYDEFINSIFLIKPETWLLDYSYYGTICFVALTLLAGIVLYKVYVTNKGFESVPNKWIFDGLKFMLFIPILAVYFMTLIVGLNLEIPGYLVMSLIGIVIAFIISRAFMVDAVEVNAVDEQIHEMIGSRMSEEDRKQYLKDINVEESE